MAEEGSSATLSAPVGLGLTSSGPVDTSWRLEMSFKANPGPKRYVVFANPPTTVQLESTPISDCSPWTWTWQNPPPVPSSSLPPEPPLPSPAVAPAARDEDRPILQPVVSTDPHHPSSSNPNKSKRPLEQTLDSFESPNQSLDSTKRRKTNAETDEEDETSLEESIDDTTGADSFNMDYYDDQLEYRDSIREESSDSSLFSTEKENTSCFFENSQCDKSTSPALDPAPEQTQELTITESLVYNMAEFYFDARGCTSLEKVAISSSRLYNLLFLLTGKNPCMTINLKKPRWNGVTSAQLAHFDCIDDSGATLKLALWDQAAEELEPECFVGDIVYLSAIAISTYQGVMQGSTTKGTRAQICYRFKPTHHTHVQRYQKDLRLAYDPTTIRVKELVEWGQRIYDD